MQKQVDKQEIEPSKLQFQYESKEHKSNKRD